nr:HAD family hydrolase [uncultured Aminipila sp.]
MYDIILMDLDNTILDFDTAERSSFIKIIERAGLTYTDDLLKKYKKINATLWSNLEQGKISKDAVLNTRFHEFFQLYGITVDGRAWEDQYRFYLDNSSQLIPHAEYTLTELRKMEKKIYSASNGVYSTQLKHLSYAGIIDLFDGHFISDRIKYENPSPYFLNSVLKT